jgi:hypothetical protein
MKTALAKILAAALALAFAATGAIAAPLTNADIIKMTAAGLDQTLVITAIENAADNKFDAGPDALLALAQANVPKPVIAALIQRATATTAAPSTPARFPAPAAGAGARGNHVVAYDTAFPDDTIRNLIHTAARARGWDITSDTPGIIGLNYKGYAATVGYGAGTIVITDHGGHAKTPGWARGLRAAIQKELKKLADADAGKK